MATVLSKTQNVMNWYNGELLHMAHEIGSRLLPAFNTSTGMPFPRVCFNHCDWSHASDSHISDHGTI